MTVRLAVLFPVFARLFTSVTGTPRPAAVRVAWTIRITLAVRVPTPIPGTLCSPYFPVTRPRITTAALRARAFCSTPALRTQAARGALAPAVGCRCHGDLCAGPTAVAEDGTELLLNGAGALFTTELTLTGTREGGRRLALSRCCCFSCHRVPTAARPTHTPRWNTVLSVSRTRAS